MRVVFMGTPEIAATCLEGLLTGDLMWWRCIPDTPPEPGDEADPVPGEAAWPRPMGSRSTSPPASGMRPGWRSRGALKPDVIAVVAYGRIFASGRAGYSLPGLHQHSCQPAACAAGLRPRAMGGASGAGRDRGHGHVYGGGNGRRGYDCHRRTPIDPNENAQSLLDRLAKLGAELLAETLTRLAQGPVAATPQDHTKATFAPMLTKDLCPIDWSRTPREIWNHIRGLDPWPVATMELQGKRFRVYKAVPPGENHKPDPRHAPGRDPTGLEMACGEGGVLEIQVLQADGGKRMAAPDYFRGHPLAL